MPKIPPPNEGDYPELPEKEWFEVKVKSVEPFMDEKFPNEDGTPKPRFQFIFEAVADELAGSRVWGKAGQSWHKKSNLYKIGQAIYPQASDAELYELEVPEDLEDKHLLLMGEYKDAERKYLTPTDYKPVKTAAAAKVSKPTSPAARAAAKPEPAGAIEI